MGWSPFTSFRRLFYMAAEGDCGLAYRLASSYRSPETNELTRGRLGYPQRARRGGVPSFSRRVDGPCKQRCYFANGPVGVQQLGRNFVGYEQDHCRLDKPNPRFLTSLVPRSSMSLILLRFPICEGTKLPASTAWPHE